METRRMTPGSEHGELSRPVIIRRVAIITEKGAFLAVDGKVQPMKSSIERDTVE